jgi:cleavage and polyadenylation specificity factor subunit 1
MGMHLLPSAPSRNGNTGNDSASQNGDESEMDKDTPKEPSKLHQQVLVLNQTGVLALVSPVDELLYVRLIALQTYLTTQLDQPCGLNPRAYRASESGNDSVAGGPGSGTGGMRGGVGGGIKSVVDGSLLRRWAELPKQRQMEAFGRVGVEEEVLRADLDVVGGEGLGYL